MSIPHLVALALQADGWYLRSDIIWHKPSPMPESVTDRPTKSHEYIFLLTKKPRYFYDADAVREPMQSDGKGGLWGADRSKGATPDEYHSGAHGKEPWEGQRNVNPAGRNLRDVWTVASVSYKAAHFATFPPKLIEPCIKAGTSEEGCCPECGAPWYRVVEKDQTGMTYTDLGRHVTATKTMRWEPTCRCYYLPGHAAAVPCTVLDPFMGSGTTAEVARANGCRSIGIELSEEYIELAKKRLEQGTLF